MKYVEKFLLQYIYSGHNSKQHVNMKVVDDKLKIIDDVPNSAVEMAVKEKVCSDWDQYLSWTVYFSVFEESPEAG